MQFKKQSIHWGTICAVVFLCVNMSYAANITYEDKDVLETKQANFFSWRSKKEFSLSERRATDWTIESSMKLINGGIGLLWGDTKDPASFMVVYTTKTHIYLISYSNKSSYTKILEKKALSSKIPENGTFTMKVNLTTADNKVTAYINDALCLEVDAKALPEIRNIGYFAGDYERKTGKPNKGEFYSISITNDR